MRWTGHEKRERQKNLNGRDYLGVMGTERLILEKWDMQLWAVLYWLLIRFI
jgi:hypothetical protein